MSDNEISTIEHLDPRTLKPHPNNSNVHPTEQLAALCNAFRQFGFRGLVVIDEEDVILAGHGRTQAAVMAELPQIRCERVTGWTDAKKRAFVLADNQLGAMSSIDMDMLVHEVRHISENSDIDLSLFGLDVADLLPPAAPPTAAAAMREAEAAAERRQPAADKDPDEAYREEMADKRTQGVAPIVPMYAEHHEAFVIVCENEVDEAWLRQRLGLTGHQQSYTDCKIRVPNVLTVARLREALA